MCSPKQWLLRNFLSIFWSPVFFWPTKHLIPFPIVFQIWHFHCRHIIQPRRGFVTTQEFFELPPNKFTASRATPSSPQYKIQRKRRISIQTKKISWKTNIIRGKSSNGWKKAKREQQQHQHQQDSQCYGLNIRIDVSSRWRWKYGNQNVDQWQQNKGKCSKWLGSLFM